MLRQVLLLSLICSVLAQEEACSAEGVRYGNNEAFKSIKEDGREYRCRCRGFSCTRIACILVRLPTEEPTTPQMETETEEPASEAEKEEVAIQETSATESTIDGTKKEEVEDFDPTCFDKVTRSPVQRGISFLRFSSDRKTARACSCPATGPAEITCSESACVLPDPPRRENVTFKYANGCYDEWNDAEYPSGATYTRTRFMDEDNRIPGGYKCTCLNGVMICTATDIPCCDVESGEFVPKNERFVTINSGVKVECTCDGGRSKYYGCRALDHSIAADSAVPEGITRRSSNVGFVRTRDKLKGCKDTRWTKRFYYVEDKFIQDRGLFGIWNCKCSVYTSATCRIACNRGLIKY